MDVPRIPPLNNVGGDVPPVPSIPPSPFDISNAVNYIWRSKEASQNGLPVTDEELAEAECYRAGLCLDAVGAPAWLRTMLSEFQNHTRDDIDRTIERMRHEFSVKLVNSRAGNRGALYDPASDPGEWVSLCPPNPTSRDDLMSFDLHQCMQSACALGLPDAPLDLDLIDRKREIAAELGISPPC